MSITVGIIGGGQLGQMLILASKHLGFQFKILDPDPYCPAHSIADVHIVAGFDDTDAIIRFGLSVDVVTYELEHISVEGLVHLEMQGKKVFPQSLILEIIQDKYKQKQWLQQFKIPVPKFMKVLEKEDILKAATVLGYPIILKNCCGGYDGKGNYVIRTEEEITRAFETLGNGMRPLMIEACVSYKNEISVIICRNPKGEQVIYPVAENKHVNSILDETIVPARIHTDIEAHAIQIAKKISNLLGHVGILCIEMFVVNDQVLVNELAPRPHNSGHYSIEGCITSQFEQHIRSILSLPLGDVTLKGPIVMKNLIGTGLTFSYKLFLERILALENIQLHWYNKAENRMGRKMGHLISMNQTVDDNLRAVRNAQEIFLAQEE